MELLYFILGILFISYILPIIEGLSSWLLAWLEAKKAAQSEIINQANIKMRKDAASAEEVPMRQIGFQLPDEEIYEEEDEY